THPGYRVYKEHCRRCHGAWGDAKRATRMAGRPVDLGSTVYQDTTAVDTIRAVIANGKGRMKGYATQLGPPDLETVTSFVFELPDARREAGKP
ncbi:MAG TPA: cytochrome c, partial [Candidatus Eisenbacteria bacterium]|nr:cytochrome c [Candidatus Eisenbacteria bacterium]